MCFAVQGGDTQRRVHSRAVMTVYTCLYGSEGVTGCHLALPWCRYLNAPSKLLLPQPPPLCLGGLLQCQQTGSGLIPCCTMHAQA